MSKERHPNILPECYADTLLVHLLGFKYPNHCPSIGAVANTMKKQSLAIGVIDRDKRQPKYFSEFDLLEEKHDLQLKKHPNKRHYLIVVSPAFEKWIFKAADSVDVKPEKYGFKTWKRFKNISKSRTVDRNQDFKQFINAIKQKKSPPTEQMIEWIQDILDKNL